MSHRSTKYEIMKIKILLFNILLVICWPQIEAQTGECWGSFRGDPKLTGVSQATIPDQPAMLWNFNTQGSIMAAPVDAIFVIDAKSKISSMRVACFS